MGNHYRCNMGYKIEKNNIVQFTLNRKKYGLSHGLPHFIGKILYIDKKRNTARIRTLDIYGDCMEHTLTVPLERCVKV